MNLPKVYPLAELLASPEPCPRDFGGWRLHRRSGCLVLHRSPDDYDIPLDRCRTSAAVLDWIFQIAEKSWATPRIIAGLIHALDYYLYPQATLCSFGVERGPIDARAMALRRVGQ
jgi:hypothetical protein